ncbi:hypothetical protein [Streptomyces sp. NPDC005209]|uniref:hypothetical protein n=1 Tax=Streptomyces sp. NPDC005209 TaxID=3156715 RepID=UPI0033BDD381
MYANPQTTICGAESEYAKPSLATTMALADRAIRVRRGMRSTTGSASAEPTG